MRDFRLPQSEYEQRWAQVQDACKAHDLAGLVIWARSGPALDSRADVFYLSNYHGWLGFISDFPPHWVARSQSAVVLPANEEPTLLVDTSDRRSDLISISDIRFSTNIAEAVARVLAERGLSDSRLGLVGEDVMSVTAHRALLAAAPSVDFHAVSDLVENLRMVKSPGELDLVREAAEVNNAALTAMIEVALKPGATEAEAVAAGYAVGVARCMAPIDAAVASGPNTSFFAYGQAPPWTNRTLEAGDLCHIVHWAAVRGYLTDPGRTIVVGGKPGPGQIRVVEAVGQALEKGIAAIRPGIPASAVHRPIHDHLIKCGMVVIEEDREGETSVGQPAPGLGEGFAAYGHSIGLSWGWPYIHPDEEREIKAGMCFGIEAMAGDPTVGFAFIEESLIVTESGAELLTTMPNYYW